MNGPVPSSHLDDSAGIQTVDDFASEEEFLSAVDDSIRYFSEGDLITGKVVRVDRDEVLVDVSYKTEGVINQKELSVRSNVVPSDLVQVGDEISALVLIKEDKDGRLILSKRRAQFEQAWENVAKIKAADGVISGTVIEVVKGGLIVDIGLRGFLPASLIDLRRVRDFSSYLEQQVDAKILELDKTRNNVVLSRRALLEETQSVVRSQVMAQLEKGQVRTGVISSIVSFGAFVDLGGVDGLVHVSELSWKHVDHASELYNLGDEVTVEVLEVDSERDRVSLSIRATQEDPWKLLAKTHAIGHIVPGEVCKFVPFGAFVKLAEGVEGLVHLSELSVEHVDQPEAYVSLGERVFVKIIDIDLERRRISLSVRQADEGLLHDAPFDPATYGMVAEYDEEGNYKYPEGFDPNLNEWLPGFETQKTIWEEEYSKAQSRYDEHKSLFEAKRAKQSGLSSGTDTSTDEGGLAYGDENNRLMTPIVDSVSALNLQPKIEKDPQSS